jgi:lytic cellulose monooxygenase (C1-hydroxylating)
MNPKPKLPSWFASGYGQGAVQPDRFHTVSCSTRTKDEPNVTQSDIICHENSHPGEAYAQVKAGSTVQIQWTPWPDSHHGPVIDYLAECTDCLTVSPTALRWTKIQESGLVQPGSEGKYAFGSDSLIKHNSTWEVRIPPKLKSGNYVLRTEIIALHVAGQSGGAQNYPQCFNLKVVGGGQVKLPTGVPATTFYARESPGIVFNLYTKLERYPIPGPPLWTGAN